MISETCKYIEKKKLIKNRSHNFFLLNIDESNKVLNDVKINLRKVLEKKINFNRVNRKRCRVLVKVVNKE